MLVSVVIPVYNREKELIRAIKSVLNQTVQDFEILVVDDFSEIDLKKVCANFQDSRIRYHKLEVKGNANVCRNYGIKCAQGIYIAMLDSDDEWLCNHLELKLSKIKECDVDGLFGSVIVDNGQDKMPVISRTFHENEKMVNYLLSGGSAPTPSHFYKAECAKDILWDETLIRHQDYDFSVRFANKYKFRPSQDITCIVHWAKGELRPLHVESQIKFIKKYKDSINPKLYNQYYYNLYSKIEGIKSVSDFIKNYAKKESYRHFSYCSLNDFMTVNARNKNKAIKLFYRIKFALKIITS